MTKKRTCEWDDCGSTEDVEIYHWPMVEDNEPGTIHLCFDCAKKAGFCTGCGHFVLGSGDDYTMPKHGLCAPCLEEFKYEIGEYEDDDYDGYYYDAYD